jgi:hypothetical protein
MTSSSFALALIASVLAACGARTELGLAGGAGGSPGGPGGATTTQVHAFSGALRTPGLWSGVMQPIGPNAVAVDRSQDFVVSWTPEGQGGESVLLSLQQIRSNGIVTCFCHVPDAASAVSVDTSLLGLFGTEQLMGTIRLERLITSFASSDDATTALVGEVLETADATFY